VTSRVPVQPWSRRFLRAAVALCSRILVVAAVVGMLLPWISHVLSGHDGRIAWAVDLAAHWQWLYLAMLAVGALLGATIRRGWLFALLLAPLPWWSAAPRMENAMDSRAEIAVVAVNVHVSTRDAADLARWLASTSVDLVVVSEVSPAFAESLERLPGFPHREVAPAENPFGIAVLSRFPMDAVAVRDADGVAHRGTRRHRRGVRRAVRGAPDATDVPTPLRRAQPAASGCRGTRGPTRRSATRRGRLQRDAVVERVFHPLETRHAACQRLAADVAEPMGQMVRHPDRSCGGQRALACTRRPHRPRAGFRSPAAAGEAGAGRIGRGEMSDRGPAG
jgi:hypothetical protein